MTSRGLPAWLAMVIIVAFLAHLGATARLMFTGLNMNDFGKFYYTASQFLEGREMYPTAPVDAGRDDGWRVYGFLNTNPPHFHLPLLAIARLPPGGALAVWAAGSVAALVWSIVLIGRELRLRVTPGQGLWLLAGLLAMANMEAVVITGQLSLFLLAGMTLAWRAARHHRWGACGGWLGLVASIKPFGLIFVPWLILRRDWRGLGAFAATAAVAFAIGLAVFGWDAHAGWIRSLGGADFAWATMNASLLGALSRWLADSPFFTPPLNAPHLVQPLWLVTAALVAIVTFVSAARAGADDDVDRAFGLLVLGALLISPLGWVYYWWLALPAAAAFLASRRTISFRLAMPCLFAPLGLVTALSHPGWALTVGSAYFWGTLLLWMSLLQRRR